VSLQLLLAARNVKNARKKTTIFSRYFSVSKIVNLHPTPGEVFLITMLQRNKPMLPIQNSKA
jgi:hypothetical protein